MMLLYFWTGTRFPEPPGMWVSGAAADIIVRTGSRRIGSQ